MTSSSLWRVPSGVGYRILAVGDTPPASLSDLVGDVTFRLDAGQDVYEVSGTGAVVDGSVRFFEKTPTGKDLRVWSVTEVDGGFEAAHAAVF